MTFVYTAQTFPVSVFLYKTSKDDWHPRVQAKGLLKDQHIVSTIWEKFTKLFFLGFSKLMELKNFIHSGQLPLAFM